MRNLEDIEKDLTAAREALSSVEGTPAEVYSRIVGYYRSVRNWNRGKREEYGERRLYRYLNSDLPAAVPSPSFQEEEIAAAACKAQPTEFWPEDSLHDSPAEAARFPAEDMRLLLFFRYTCPGCPPAKAAAVRLGIPVNLLNADTAEGMAEAVKFNVLSTPTAILLSPDGNELGRAGDAEAIGRLLQHKDHAALPIAV